MKLKMKFLFPVTLLSILFLSSFTISEWTSVYNDNGIELSYKEADCKLEMGGNQRWFLVQIRNNSNAVKMVEWDLDLFDQNGKAFRCNNTSEAHRIVKVGPGETIEGTCSIKTQPELKQAEKMLDIKTVNEVREVKVKNVTVKNFD